jgi:hypothetical protein
MLRHNTSVEATRTGMAVVHHALRGQVATPVWAPHLER